MFATTAQKLTRNRVLLQLRCMTQQLRNPDGWINSAGLGTDLLDTAKSNSFVWVGWPSVGTSIITAECGGGRGSTCGSTKHFLQNHIFQLLIMLKMEEGEFGVWGGPPEGTAEFWAATKSLDSFRNQKCGAKDQWGRWGSSPTTGRMIKIPANQCHRPREGKRDRFDTLEAFLQSELLRYVLFYIVPNPGLPCEGRITTVESTPFQGACASLVRQTTVKQAKLCTLCRLLQSR